MTDYSRDRLGPEDEDRLPWLEPVEEEYEEGGVSTGRLILWLTIAVAVIALIIGGFLWMRSSDKAASGDGALIKAPDSYYKERPAEQAGPTADDEIVYSASKGNEVESVIDTGSAAETPVNVDRPTAEAVPPPTVSAPKPAPAAAKPTAPAAKPTVEQALPKQAVKTAPVKPAAPVAAPAEREPASGGSMVQLGAFSSQAKANAAWKNLSGRFSFLKDLTQSVVPVQSGDKTLYRLRAGGGNAGDICRRLRTAGESCSVIG
ncbi:SPOR domain-containing protein [Rhizorhabdus dicambivorans]|uniref:SPOR domain-containing protein n=1 Tax=Rhizorhabdus dicambivorans TaxID=1850238 RepID=A0A2A4G1K5_9SPHN|nr:SPOR domain-containing protein [Rhizorhabdus dicambivorans]ATE66631.1 SPOR domain-containing protein [Rhizorhabdus dicambivorans]PCE43885.1 SPOR domain-containing protein [Rhizorhabdus dicambivorans]